MLGEGWKIIFAARSAHEDVRGEAWGGEGGGGGLGNAGALQAGILL